MTKKITKQGNVTGTLQGNGFKAVDDLLRMVTPNAQKVLQQEFAKIEAAAKSQWLIRGAKKIDAEARKKRALKAMRFVKGYDKEKAEAIVRSMEEKGVFDKEVMQEISKGSKDKIYTGVRVTKNAKVQFVIGNSAEYAWAIKVGVNSDTNLPRGTRIANELLWKPSKKATDIIVQAIADDLMKSIK